MPINFLNNASFNAAVTVATTGTFGGNVTLSSALPLLYLTNTTASTGKNWRLSSATNGKFFIAQEGVVDAVTLEHTSGDATFAGNVDVNGTHLRFKSTGAAFIDHNTVAQSIKFRLSSSSSLDVTPLEITPSYASFANVPFVGTMAAGDNSTRAASTAFVTTAVAAGSVQGSGTLNTIPLWTPDGDTLGNSVMTQSGVNIGIGTTSYTNSSGFSTLNINGTTGGQIAFQTAGTSKHFIWGTATDFNIYNGQAGPLIFYTSASEAMRINASRDVLIGNTVVNPASNFSNQKGFAYKFSTGQTEIANTGGETLTLGRNIAADGNILVLRKQATVIGVFGSNTAGGDPLLDIASAPGENSLMRFLTSGTERLRIGNAGLATFRSTYVIAGYYGGEITLGGSDTTFGLQLKYTQDASTTSTLYHSPGYANSQNLFKLGAGSGNTNQLVLKGDGNVGIGLASPDTLLHLKSTGPVITLQRDNNGNAAGAINFEGNDGVLDWQIATNFVVGLGFEFNYAGSNKVYINTNGHVGIGMTNTGNASLNINGNLLLDSNAEIQYSLTSGGPYLNVRSRDSTTSACGIRIKSPYGNPGYFYGEGTTGTNSYIGILDSDGAWGYQIRTDTSHLWNINNSAEMFLNATGLGIKTTNITAELCVGNTSDTNVKVTRIGGDTTTVYRYGTSADAVLEWTCGSYHNAEVVITASQTNGGTYNNLYIRGIWTNNHTFHSWDELEHVGSLTGTAFTITNGQNGSTTNSGRLTLDVNYTSGSFATLNVRITDFFGSHSYTIT